MGTKTTVVRCVLRNGFEIVESTGCVDEKLFLKIGYEICMERIKNKLGTSGLSASDGVEWNPVGRRG